MSNLDNHITENGKKGLIWYLLIAYSAVITALFGYLNSQQINQIEYLKTEIKALREENKLAHDKALEMAEKARQDERIYILQTLKGFQNAK